MKILVVDDENFNIKVVEGFLKTLISDTEIILCKEPQNVIEIFEREKVDILLLDIMMPKISGIDILSNIRSKKEYEDVQIIMLTASNSKESFKICFELGANDYILKPIDATEFQARLKSAIKTRKNNLLVKEMLEQMKLQNNELKKVNASLKDTQFHLIQSEKMAAIGELAAGIAHEINNPLGYVSSNLETLCKYLNKIKEYIAINHEKLEMIYKTFDNEETKNIYNSILESYNKLKIERIVNDLSSVINDSRDGVDKVSEIVKTLRSFARTGMEDEREFYEVLEIINQVLLIVKNEAKYTVEISLAIEETPGLWCHKGQIGQVLLNIIINAIQAIKSQQRNELGKICIHTYYQDQWICIGISDDGPGISEENLDKIFNPFFTTKEVGQGTGLGLSISHDIIVKKHNGVLEVKSNIGKGTEFIIKLPEKIQ